MIDRTFCLLIEEKCERILSIKTKMIDGWMDNSNDDDDDDN